MSASRKEAACLGASNRRELTRHCRAESAYEATLSASMSRLYAMRKEIPTLYAVDVEAPIRAR